MARHESWLHGVGVVVEYPQRASEIRHAGWGTLVRQPAGSDNWFHFPLPTARVIATQNGILRETRLRAEVNENARIDLIHTRDDAIVVFSRAVAFTDRVVDEVFQTPDLPVKGGITLCVHVTFLTGSPVGTVILRSAGAAFLT